MYSIRRRLPRPTKYAKEKYGAEVFAFDGQSDGAIMTQNVDQVLAQGMDAATMQLWEPEAAVPGIMDALDAGLIMTSFFSPVADTGIPVARSDEAGISFEMGVEAATQWKEATSRYADHVCASRLAEPHRSNLRAWRAIC